MLLIQLLGYSILIFFGFIGAMYIISRKFFKLSPEETEKQIKDMLLTGFGMLKNRDIEPKPTDVLRQNCFTILQNKFALEKGATKCEDCDNFGFYALQFRIVATYNEETFQLTTALLEECAMNYFAPLNSNVLLYVFYEKFGDNKFYFYVCYAFTDTCRTNLLKFIESRNNVIFNKAVTREKPVVNAQLQQELAAMKKGDENV